MARIREVGVVVDLESAESHRERLLFENQIFESAGETGSVLSESQQRTAIGPNAGFFTLRLITFAVLDDGTRVVVPPDRQSYELDVVRISSRGSLPAWSVKDAEDEVRQDFLLDQDAEGRWEQLADVLCEQGTDTSPEQIDAFPFRIDFTDSARTRLAEP